MSFNMDEDSSSSDDSWTDFSDIFFTAITETNPSILHVLLERERFSTEFDKTLKLLELLGFAIKNEKTEFVHMLLEYGACVKSPVDTHNQTALQLAVTLRDKPTIELLLKYKADPKITDARFRSLLHLVLENTIPDIDTSPTHQELQEKIIDIMKILISRGLDVNKRTNRGETPLYFAVQQRLTRVAKFLIDNGANVNCTTKKGESLAFALIESDIKIRELLSTLIHFRQSMTESANHLRYLISVGLNIDLKTKKGKSPLELVAEKNAKHLMKVFIEHTEDIFFKTKKKQTILHLLLAQNSGCSQQLEYDNEIALKLIDKGAPIDVADANGNTPFHLAAQDRRLGVLRRMIDRGIDIHASDRKGTPIWRVALDALIDPEHEDTLISLVRRGVDVNRKNQNGDTPVQTAARSKHKKLLGVLEELGADFTVIDDSRNNLLHLISRPYTNVKGRFDEETVQLLIEKGCDVNAPNNAGKTPLHMACWIDKNIDVVRALIKRGAKLQTREQLFRRMPLHVAADTGDIDIITCLEEAGADIDCRDQYSNTPMHVAAQNGHKAAVDLLTRLKGNVNATNEDGATPLMMAVCRNDRRSNEVVKTLIRRGADVNNCRLRESNFAPLHEAARRKDVDVVEILLDNGADVSCQDNPNKLTPLHVAAHSGDVNVVRMLIEKGADVHAKDKSLMTPLHQAVYKENDEVIKCLVECGADINATDISERTPLHLAIRYQNKSVETLLELGAKTDIKCAGGYTPLHEALDCENKAAFGWLVEFRVDVNEIGDDQNELFLKEVMQERTKIAESLVQYAVKLKAIGFPVSEGLEMYVDTKKPEVKLMQEECENEVKLLKNAVIKGEKDSSIYSLLYMHPHKRYPFYKSKDFKQIVDRRTRGKNYPIYCDIIVASYRETMSYEKLFLTAPARNAWYELTKVYLPEICVDLILYYLNLEDMKRMIQGVEKGKRKKSPSAGTKLAKKMRKK